MDRTWQSAQWIEGKDRAAYEIAAPRTEPVSQSAGQASDSGRPLPHRVSGNAAFHKKPCLYSTGRVSFVGSGCAGAKAQGCVGQPCRCCWVMSRNAPIQALWSFRQGIKR